MQVNKVKEGRKLTSIKFEHEYYLANLMIVNKCLGIPLKKAKELCNHKLGEVIQIDPPLPIVSDLDLDELIDKLDEYGIIISISISSNNHSKTLSK